MFHTITCPFCEKPIASNSSHCPECSLANPLGAGLQELKDQVADRNLIVAIKKMREIFPGVGLADAKFTIEKLVAHKGQFPQSIEELLVLTDRSQQPESTASSNLSQTTNAQPIPQNLETNSSSRIATRLATLENKIKREEKEKKRPKLTDIPKAIFGFGILVGILGAIAGDGFWIGFATGAILGALVGVAGYVLGNFAHLFRD